MRCWHRLPLQGPPAVQPLHAAAPAPLAFHRAPCTSRTSLRQHITPTTAVARAAASGSEVGPAAGQQIAGARADADSSDDEYMEHSLPTALLGEDEEQLEQLEQLGSASWDEDAASHPTPRSGRGRRHQSPAPRVSGSALSQELSRRITSSETVVQLLDAVQLHGEHADDDAVAAAFQQVAKLVTALPPRTAGSDAAQPAESLVPVQQLLRLLLPRLEACAHSMGLSSLTQVMWACSKLQRCTSLLEPLVAPGLQAVLTQLLQRGVGASSGPPGSRKAAGGPLQVASPRLGAKLLHDVALLGLDTEDKQQVFVWLLGSLRPLLPQAKAEDLSTCALALALATGSGSRRYQDVWHEVAREAARQLSVPETARLFNSHSLDHLALAVQQLGTAGCPDTLVPALRACIKALPVGKPASTAATLVAAIHVGVSDEDSWFSSRAAEVATLVPGMSVQNLASTLWAYTTAEARDWGVLLDAAVDCLRGKPSWHFRGQPQSIVHVLWALTKHDRKEAEIFVALQREARACLADMSHKEQSTLLVAVSKLLDRMSEKDTPRYLELVNQELVSELLATHMQPRITSMDATQVVRVASSLTLMRWLDGAVNSALASRASQLVDALSLQQVSVLFQWLAKVVVVQAQDGSSGGSRTPRAGAPPAGAMQLPHDAAQLWDQLMARSMVLIKQAGTVPTRHINAILWSTALLHPEDSYNLRYLVLQVANRHSKEDDAHGHLSTTITQVVLATALLGRPLDVRGPAVQAFVRRSVREYQERLCRDTRPSSTQLQVYAEVAQVPGVTAVELEVPVCGGLLSVDVMVRYHGHDICIEVDGPFHFMLNRQGLVTGDTLFRRQILGACGYRLVSVRATEVASLGTIQARRRMLEHTLQMAMQAPQQLARREKDTGERKDKLYPPVSFPRAASQSHQQDSAETRRTLEAAEFALSAKGRRAGKRPARR